MERWLGQMKEKGFDLKAYQESVEPRDAGQRDTPPQPERVSPVMPVRAEPEAGTQPEKATREKPAGGRRTGGAGYPGAPARTTTA
jgi:hypothetical protein